jgi:flagellar biosynthesis protein FliR
LEGAGGIVEWISEIAGQAVLITAARLAGLVAFAPFWGAGVGVDFRNRVVLVVWLTAAVAPTVAQQVPAGEISGWMLLGELGIGSAMGLAAGVILAAARQAGQLVALQVGLGPGSIASEDPDSGESSAFGHLYGVVAAGAFLAVDGPFRLFAALVRSYEWMEPGGLGDGGLIEGAQGLAHWMSRGIELALLVALPVLLAVGAANLVVAWLEHLRMPTGRIAVWLIPGLSLVAIWAGLAGCPGLVEAAWERLLDPSVW